MLPALTLLSLAALSQAKYPQIDIAAYRKGTPGYAVAGFVSGWRRGKIEAIMPYLQASARKDLDHARLSLRFYLDRPLLGAKIVATKPVRGLEDMLADVRVKVWPKKPDGAAVQEWSFRVVRESKASTPDPHGIWGVNPVASGPLASRR